MTIGDQHDVGSQAPTRSLFVRGKRSEYAGRAPSGVSRAHADVAGGADSFWSEFVRSLRGLKRGAGRRRHGDVVHVLHPVAYAVSLFQESVTTAVGISISSIFDLFIEDAPMSMNKLKIEDMR